MSKFTPTSKRNGACEVCGDESSKCRRYEEIHLCMSFADAKLGEVQNGMKCIKPDKGKGWATFKPDDSQEWSEEQRREWKAKAQERRQKQAIETEERQKRSLAAPARDRLYRQLLNELELHPDDYKDLKRRGFSDLEIELIGVKSVTHYQTLHRQYPELLPGISAGGKQLINLGTGYLCPVRNKDGLIVACQLRLRVLASGQGNRFRWLSGGEDKKQVPHFFPTGGNPQGEMPLAICRPTTPPLFVALAEGTGAKPNFVALRWNLFTIGAAGGQWLSSEATFKEAIDLGIAECGDRCIRLFPDAGDILNRAVASRWQQIIFTLQQWGYAVQVGWWNQRTKEDSDIDELTPEEFAQISYLEAKDFLAILAEQFPTRGFGANAEAKADLRTKKTWDLWHTSRQFKADYYSNQQYFSALVPERGTATYIRSGTGTGKTRWLLFVIKLLAEHGFLSVGYRNSLLIQFSEEEDLAGTWHHLQQDLKGSPDAILIRDPHSKILCCIDSLTHFAPQDFDGKILIFDEVESIVEQLLKANTAVSFQREKIKYLFVEALKRCDRVIFLDGHLRDSTVEYLQKLMGNCKKPVRYLNTYTGNKGRVELLQGVKTIAGVNRSDRSPIIEAVLNNTDRFVVGADSQEEIESLERMLIERGRKTLRFDSTTARNSWAKLFLKNPAKYLKDNDIEILLYSPSAEAGLNIDIKGYFTDAYFLFFGVITTNAQLQLMARVRDPQMHIHIWCAVKGFPSQTPSESTLPQKLSAEIRDYVLDSATTSLSGISREEVILNLAQRITDLSADRHHDQEILLMALEDHERANLWDCLQKALRDSGYQVDVVSGEHSAIHELRENRQEIRREKSIRIYQASDITTEEANVKARSFGITDDDKFQVMRRRLLDRLPGIESATYQILVRSEEQETTAPESSSECPTAVELSEDQVPPNASPSVKTIEKPVFDSDFIKHIKWDDRQLVSQIELLWLIKHPDQAKLLEQIRWHKRLSIFTNPEEPDWNKTISLSNYHSRWLKIYRLLEMKIEFFLQPGATWHAETPEAIAFLEAAKHPRNARAIGRKVGKSKVCSYIGEILEAIGLKTECSWGKDEEGNKVRVYCVSQGCLSDPIRTAIYEAVGRRFEKMLSSDRALLDWQAVVDAAEEVQSLIPQSVEGGSPSENYVLKSQEGDLTQSAQPMALGLPSQIESAEATAISQLQEDWRDSLPLTPQGTSVQIEVHPPIVPDLESTVQGIAELLVEAQDYGRDALVAIWDNIAHDLRTKVLSVTEQLLGSALDKFYEGMPKEVWQWVEMPF